MVLYNKPIIYYESEGATRRDVAGAAVAQSASPRTTYAAVRLRRTLQLRTSCTNNTSSF